MSQDKPNTASPHREWWIFKGDSNFCSELDMNENFVECKSTPDGFYDVVCEKDTVEGGIHVISYAALTEARAEIDELKKFRDLNFQPWPKMYEQIEALKAEVTKLTTALNLAREALTEITGYGHSENCQNMKPVRPSYRCHSEEATKALNKINELLNNGGTK